MSVLPAQTIRAERPLAPICDKYKQGGVSGGLGPAGYDVKIAQDLWFWPGRFNLASTVECFRMPDNIIGVVHDKSTWARCGLAVQNTVIEPGWFGNLTLEITKHGWTSPRRRFRWWPVFRLRAGTPIAQVIFHRLEEPTERPYTGKYQDQPARPVVAILE